MRGWEVEGMGRLICKIRFFLKKIKKPHLPRDLLIPLTFIIILFKLRSIHQNSDEGIVTFRYIGPGPLGALFADVIMFML